MSTNCNNLNPLLRDGTSQQQRTLQALLPEYVAVDDRSIDDLREFAEKFAEEIRFYELDGTALNDWTKFFDKSLTTDEKNEPHYALFMAFLEMFRVAQNDLNKLSKRHLDFFYRDVLGLKEKAAVPDQVYTIFKIASQVSDHLISAGTQLDAKKDPKGNDLVYQTDRNIVVNQAKVEQLKAIYIKRDILDDVVGPHRIYASPIANSMDGQGRELETSDKRWKTFGRPVRDAQTKAVMQTPGELGFAIASPVLALAEGARNISIRITFNGKVNFKSILFLRSATQNFVEQKNDSVFNFSAKIGKLYGNTRPTNIRLAAALAETLDFGFSGEKEWIKPENQIQVVMDSKGDYMDIFVSLGEGQKPVVGYNAEVLKQNFKTTLPLLKCTLKSSASYDSFFAVHQLLEQVSVKQVKISADVFGVKNLILQNDEAMLAAEKPFQPFGSSPRVGSSFYIGSNEAFSKRLDTIKFNIEWFGVPTSFVTHYRFYEPKPRNTNHTPRSYYRVDSDFSVALQYLDERQWQGNTSRQLFRQNYRDTMNIHALKDLLLTTKDASVFTIEKALFKNGASVYATKTNPTTAMTQAAEHESNASSTLALGDDVLLQHIPLDKFGSRHFDLSGDVNEDYTPLTRRGFVRMVLNKHDFGHNDYASSYSKRAFEVAADLEVEDKSMPREPYTPVIRSISIDYETSDTITLETKLSTTDSGLSHFFHVMPFGTVECKYSPKKAWTIIPQFLNEGNLYIGLSGVHAPQTLSLLLKVADGTANPDYLPPVVKWYYLADDEWIKFDDIQILSNSTSGLLNSGIITFDLPRAFKNNNTSMPEGLFWLRASVVDSSDSVCQLINVHAQAVTATFNDRNNDTSHLLTALPAETIKESVLGDALLDEIKQPYSSFGGKVAESSASFYTRVSERLRHKHRAITIWDYEHIVLEEYPSVFKIKCLNHTRMLPLDYSERAPGHVSLVVLPDIRNKNASNPLKPKASLLLLEQIRQYINALNSPAVDLHVRNPFFEEVQLDFEVKFHVGFDNGFYAKQLDEDIRKFLAPWAYDGQDLTFGGKLHKTVVLDFVEDLPYVDYVTCFRMNQFVPIEALRASGASQLQLTARGQSVLRDIDEAIATTSASILTSARSHKVKVLESEVCDCPDNDVKQPYLPPTFNDPDCGDDPTNGLPNSGIGVDVVEDSLIVGHTRRNSGIGYWIINNDFNVQ